MQPTRLLLILSATLACASGARAFDDYPVQGGQLSLGIDGTLDAAFGASGEAAGHESLFGTVLGHACWTQPTAATRPVNYSAYASFLWIDGRGPSQRVIGDFLGTDNAEGYQSLRLYSWWAQAEHEAWSLRAGALLADEEFAGTTSGATLINSTFGWPTFISANTLNTGPAYYVPALGVRLAYDNPSGWSAKGGVYDGDSLDSQTGDPRPSRHGIHYDLGGRQGFFMIGELSYAPKDSANRYHLGAWHHTADFADLRTGAAHSGDQGAYAIFERTLAGKTGEPGNIEAHARFGLAPSDRNAVACAFDTAVAATGLMASRPADVIALGFAHAEMSPDLSGQDYEQVVELSYSARVNDHVTMQPDVQCIMHPGAASSNEDAWLLMLRIKASY